MSGFKIVDESSFEQDFQKKIMGNLAGEEKKHAMKRLEGLRKTILEERKELHALFAELNSTGDVKL